ncbi:MAG: FHA domain-containing protein [Porcipelethomonas sp.]
MEGLSEFLSEFFGELSAFKEIIAAAAIILVDVCALFILCFCTKEKKTVQKQWAAAARHVVLTDAEGAFRFAPSSQEILMGRHISADLRFTDLSVSRYHAILSLEDGIWTITDLDSTTGTFVNGERIKESRRLRPNDEIKIGKKILYLRKERM